MIEFSCSCGQALFAPREAAGLASRCPACEEPQTVPQAGPPPRAEVRAASPTGARCEICGQPLRPGRACPACNPSRPRREPLRSGFDPARQRAASRAADAANYALLLSLLVLTAPLAFWQIRVARQEASAAGIPVPTLALIAQTLASLLTFLGIFASIWVLGFLIP